MNKETKRRKALALLADGTDIRVVAQRYGVSVRTLERWKAAASAVAPDAGDVVTDSDDSPRETSPDSPEKPNPALDEALKAAGEAPKDSTKPTPEDIQQAVIDKAEFCVSTINNIRMAAGVQTVKWVYSPPLHPTSPEVMALYKLDPFTEMAVRNQADRLYGPLVNLAGNPYVLYVSLAISTLGMFIGISKLAEARGWEPKKKAEKPKTVPTMEQYAAQLRPKPHPEAAPVSVQAAAPPKPGADMIFDAPLPPMPDAEEVEEEA